MKYLKVIAVCFLIGAFADMTVVLIAQAGNRQADTDMKDLAYALAVGFNLLLALGTLPVYLNAIVWIRENIFAHIASFFLLPLMVTTYLTFSDATEQWTVFAFCIPYLIVLVFFFLNLRQWRRG